MSKVIQCQECLPLLHILGQLQLSQAQNEETQQAAHVKRRRIGRSNWANNYIFTTSPLPSPCLSFGNTVHYAYIVHCLNWQLKSHAVRLHTIMLLNCNYTNIRTYVCTCMLTMYKTMSQTMYKCYSILGLHTLDQMLTLLNAGIYTEHTRVPRQGFVPAWVVSLSTSTSFQLQFPLHLPCLLGTALPRQALQDIHCKASSVLCTQARIAHCKKLNVVDLTSSQYNNQVPMTSTNDLF